MISTLRFSTLRLMMTASLSLSLLASACQSPDSSATASDGQPVSGGSGAAQPSKPEPRKMEHEYYDPRSLEKSVSGAVSDEELYSLEKARVRFHLRRIDGPQSRVSPSAQPSAEKHQLAIDPALVNIGSALWDLILSNNRPVGVDFERIQAQALPRGVSDPMQLSPWAGVSSFELEMGVENVLGMDLLSSATRVQFHYGAPYQGQGRHIANLTASPQDYHALIGFTGNVRVRTSVPVYRAGGVASILMTVEANIRGPLDDLTQSRTVEILGDGSVNER